GCGRMHVASSVLPVVFLCWRSQPFPLPVVLVCHAPSVAHASLAGRAMSMILARPLTREAFRPFGDVIEVEGADNFLINNGNCCRFHDLAKVEATGENARVLINIFRAQPCPLPHSLGMVERHPFGSQAFMPLAP